MKGQLNPMDLGPYWVGEHKFFVLRMTGKFGETRYRAMVQLFAKYGNTSLNKRLILINSKRRWMDAGSAAACACQLIRGVGVTRDDCCDFNAFIEDWSDETN